MRHLYSATANPLGPVSWGRITAKPGKLYLHVFTWPKDNRIVVPLKNAGALKASMLADAGRQPLDCAAGAEGVTVTLKPGFQNPDVSVVLLETGARGFHRNPRRRARSAAGCGLGPAVCLNTRSAPA